MSHEADNSVVGVFVVPEEPRSVERVKPCDGDGRRVTDVVQHGSGFQQFGVIPQDRAQRAGAFGNPQGVRPPTRERPGQQRFGERIRPLSEFHGGQGYGRTARVGRARTVRPLP